MSTEKISYGLFVIDRSGVTIATLIGDELKNIESFSAQNPRFKRCSAMINGGYRSYIRLIDQAAVGFFKKAGNLINKHFLGKALKGLIIGGAGPTKEFFAKSEYLDERLRKKIIAIIDIGYSDEQGIKELVKKSRDLVDIV